MREKMLGKCSENHQVNYCLKTGQHSIFAIIRKINNTRMLDILFIDDSIDIMEQYFHYYNHNNWQLYIKKFKQYLRYGFKKYMFNREYIINM